LGGEFFLSTFYLKWLKKNFINFFRVNQKTLSSILEEAETKKKEILELFQQVSCELEGINYHR
jgi:F0F1-type ATP synthase membrane subunit b/b'